MTLAGHNKEYRWDVIKSVSDEDIKIITGIISDYLGACGRSIIPALDEEGLTALTTCAHKVHIVQEIGWLDPVVVVDETHAKKDSLMLIMVVCCLGMVVIMKPFVHLRASALAARSSW